MNSPTIKTGKSIIEILLLLLVSIPVLYSHARASSHEFGLGLNYIYGSDDFKNGYGISLYYDLTPKEFYIIRTKIGANIMPKNYWDGIQTIGYVAIDLPEESKNIFVLSLEESLLYEFTNKYSMPYIGFGVNLNLVSHKDDLFQDSNTDFRFGYHIQAGLKYSLSHKLNTYFEAKYTLANKISIESGSYSYRGYAGGFILQRYSADKELDFKRLSLQLGISYRL